MSKGEAFFPPIHKVHQHEAIFEGGPLHNQVRAIPNDDLLIEAKRLVGNIPTGEVNVETVQYLRHKDAVSTGPNVTRWRYLFVPDNSVKPAPGKEPMTVELPDV